MNIFWHFLSNHEIIRCFSILKYTHVHVTTPSWHKANSTTTMSGTCVLYLCPVPVSCACVNNAIWLWYSYLTTHTTRGQEYTLQYSDHWIIYLLWCLPIYIDPSINPLANISQCHSEALIATEEQWLIYAFLRKPLLFSYYSIHCDSL